MSAVATIIFAGLSGLPPQFIDQGPDKGFGWVEYETYDIRKSLKESGIPIAEEWMTPARIAHEFRQGSPICTYPVKWKNPSQTFASKQKRILSIPIKLEGNESRKILFHQEDSYKFQKYVDKKGDINIDALLSDKQLKTLLVRDFDYGALGLKLLGVDEKGDQFVRKEYSDHVILLLVKNNQQLIEMLNAHRFDYIFADSVEAQDFSLTGIKRDKFREVTYQTEHIGEDIRDPNLVMVSIACSVHPSTIKLMPLINEKISRLRDLSWYRIKDRYREKIDPKFSMNLSGDSLLHTSQFRGAMETGSADYWYPKQQALVPGLLKFPAPLAQVQRPSLPIAAHPLRWRSFVEESGSLTVVNEAAPDYRRPVKSSHLVFMLHHYPEAMFEKFLSLAQRKKLLDPSALFDGESGVSEFEHLKSPDAPSIRKLTLFASGVSSDQLRRLFLSFSNLKEVVVFGAGTDATTELVKLLPKGLEKLSLIQCSLSHSDIQTRVREMPLKALHLNASQVTRRQMGELITNLSDSVSELSLGFHRGAFSRDTAKKFGEKSWPNLVYLDLENDQLFDDHFELLRPGLTSRLRTLKLGLNSMGPKAFSQLFSRPFPELEELDLSANRVISSVGSKVTLPVRVKRLFLGGSGLKPENMERVAFPLNLEILDLSENALGDDALLKVLPSLGDRVQYLDLSATGAGDRVIGYLAKEGRFKQIQELRLDSNGLLDSQLGILSRGSFDLEKLSLRGNLIHNGGAELIARRWMRGLKALDLSQNLISEAGVSALAREMGSGLQELALGALVGLDVKALGPKLPRSLYRLDLSGNQISDFEIKELAAYLPSSLRELVLANSAFGAEGAWHLARALPPRLNLLSLQGVSIGNQGFTYLAQSLPASLKDLRIGPALLEASGVDALASNFPKSLRRLVLLQVKAPSGNFKKVMGALPQSLTALALVSVPVSLDSLSELSSHWPGNLRQLTLVSGKLGDTRAAALGRNLPVSLETLSFLGLGLSDFALSELGKNSLENLHLGEWMEDSFSSESFNGFLVGKNVPWYIQITSNDQIKDGLLLSLPPESLESVRELLLSGLSLTKKGLVPLFKRLPNDFYGIDIQSAHFNIDDVDEVIEALPKGLQRLTIKGIPIGEQGKEKFRKYVKEREAKDGWRMTLVE